MDVVMSGSFFIIGFCDLFHVLAVDVSGKAATLESVCKPLFRAPQIPLEKGDFKPLVQFLPF
jgi:hypothetical protein